MINYEKVHWFVQGNIKLGDDWITYKFLPINYYHSFICYFVNVTKLKTKYGSSDSALGLAGVNFINVLRARFLYKILVTKITKLCFGFDFLAKKFCMKNACKKTLMELTAGAIKDH